MALHRKTYVVIVIAAMALVALSYPSEAQEVKNTLTPTPVPNQMAELSKAMTMVVTFVEAAAEHNIEVAVDTMGNQIVTYVNQVVADQQAAAAAYAAAHPTVRAPVASSPAPVSNGGGGGDCYAGPIPAYIVTRESGGNPTAMNPSGAYGCYQIMPYVWSANCSDLDRGVQGQIACANRISNGGTNLSPWRLG